MWIRLQAIGLTDTLGEMTLGSLPGLRLRFRVIRRLGIAYRYCGQNTVRYPSADCI